MAPRSGAILSVGYWIFVSSKNSAISQEVKSLGICLWAARPWSGGIEITSGPPVHLFVALSSPKPPPFDPYPWRISPSCRPCQDFPESRPQRHEHDRPLCWHSRLHAAGANHQLQMKQMKHCAMPRRAVISPMKPCAEIESSAQDRDLGTHRIYQPCCSTLAAPVLNPLQFPTT